MINIFVKALNSFVSYMSILEKAHMVNYRRTLRFNGDEKL